MKINYLNRDELFDVVKTYIKDAKIIADIGCGIRPQTFINTSKHICFEPHQQYIDHLKNKLTGEQRNKYSFINCDWQNAINHLEDHSVDTIFLLDVIEHVEKSIGLDLLQKTISKAVQQIVVFTPYGFIEQKHKDEKDAWGLDGAKWQEHKSGWMPKDFGEDWEFFVCEDFHTHDNLNIEYDEAKGAMFAILNLEKTKPDSAPIFSVIVPTYNQADYLGMALDSLLNQTFPLWEAIVVNDGSTDSTQEVMAKYLSLDSRIKAFHKSNGGVASALNMGIENAKGKWICWLSSDDLFVHTKLEVYLNSIIKQPHIQFFHSHWYLLLQENQKILEPGLWLQIPPISFQVTRFFWANYVHGNAICIAKSVFNSVGLFDESLRQGQDFDMWLRISAKYISHYIDERTCITRIHPGQTTNSFVEGGVLDSTRSIVKFINSVPFNQLFPFLDLSNLQNIVIALNEIVFISTKQDAFLYRCGITTALVEKTIDWLTNLAPNSLKEKIYFSLKRIIEEYLSANISEEIKDNLQLLLKRKKHDYKRHNFFRDTQKYVDQLIKKGLQQQAKSIETYLRKIAPQHIGLGEIENYHPVLLEFPSNNEYVRLNPASIRSWFIDPDSMVENLIKHELKIQCEKCETNFTIILKYEMKSSIHAERFICPSCKSGYGLNDENFSNDFVDFHKCKVDEKFSNIKSDKVIFFIKDASVLGGGTKTIFKYVDWLLELGVDVQVVSFSSKPDWVTKKIDYLKINSINDLKCDSKLYIVFSIFEVPLLLNKIPISKVIHLCQGYEGYHFGRDYVELRSDKHILTQLHSIPVKSIVVSKHLLNLFNEKFSRNSYFIPNGVDHQVFTFNKNSRGKNKSILFIGNPFHPLKGFSFLSNAIAAIQSTTLQVPNLKLQIVMGFKPENYELTRDMMIKELNCNVDFYFKLSSNEVAGLIHDASIVVCTSWYEGFSMPILEAMACGTPFITTENMGADSFCIPGQNGFSVKFGDNKLFVKQMLDIIYETTDLTSVLENGYKTSLEYSDFNSLNAFINSFEQMLSTKFSTKRIDGLLKKYQHKLLSEGYKDSLKPKNEDNPVVSIIIPIHNQCSYTRECVDSIITTTNVKYELILVDNASDLETRKYLESLTQLNNIHVVWNNENYGFPIAINQGIQLSKGRFVLIANNDIVFTNSSLERLIEVADSDTAIGIVGPISNQVSGVQKDLDANYEKIEQMPLYAELIRSKNKNEILPFPRVAFLCTLIKKELIDKIGGLDERFSPGNYEDDDFCLRAQLAGYKTAVAKDVFIHHYGSKSFKADGKNKYSEILKINRQKFVSKWGADPEEIWIKSKNFNHQHSLHISINEDEFVKRFERASNFIKDKEFDQAQEELNRAINSYESSEKSTSLISKENLLVLSANISLINNDKTIARFFFEEALKMNPSSSAACLGLGQIFFDEEFYEPAKIMFEWAVKNDPANQNALQALKTVNGTLMLPENHNKLEKQESISLSINTANE